jgi:hypothetical protein
MTTEPFYTPGKTAKPRERVPGTLLWALGKAARRLTCERRDNAEVAGSEIQLFYDGDFFSARRFSSRAMAEAWAAKYRTERERDGWAAQ